MQEQVTLLEYGLNAVTEGIDAIATTRVLIRGEKNHTLTNALTGETVHRTFRYILDICFFHVMFTSKFTVPKMFFWFQWDWGRNGYCRLQCSGLH